MEADVSNINWFVSGVVGVVSSVIGAFIFWGFQKLAVGQSSKRRAKKAEDLQKQKDRLTKLHTNTSDLLIHYLGLLFYILFLAYLGSALGYLTDFIYFPLSVIRMSIYFGAAFIAMKAFSDLAKLKSFESTIAEIDSQLVALQGGSPNK
ncbi:hypothetical protein [Marinobacterium iners]|uniref:Uncharacterized protein n=1 Tax=Marinobacterium iners DSM 11526 TaxID=1122198 RepID=A0A1H4GFV4_9GAMM|nr:hypothetical protein [Marinobacterium iners]SEB08151.1 hypothetical protein SAMN02745729_1162 [Marinobacterium iners DSM 11526]